MTESSRQRQSAHGSPNDPRAGILHRFRNYALFWIAILVAYFLGSGALLKASNAPIESAVPVLLLLFGCILIGSVWHAAAVVSMGMPARESE
ncbi:MAG: hypothetical protein KGO02_19330 [Alphaproteobacteria bacterium]|nr:hypothetical protein [Alphaproteobacteria bacterium]